MQQQKKLDFSEDVIRIVRDVAKLVFNLHSDEDTYRVFGLSNEQMAERITNIVISMPDIIFKLSPQSIEEIKNIFAKEFIFFQIIEKNLDPQDETDVADFTSVFARDIQKRFNTCSHYQSNLSEG